MESGFFLFEKKDVEDDAIEGKVTDSSGENAKNVTPGIKHNMRKAQAAVSKKKETFKAAIIKIFERIKKLLLSFVNAIKKVFESIWKKITKMVSMRVEKLSDDDASKIVDAVNTAATATGFNISNKGKEFIKTRLVKRMIAAKGIALEKAVRELMKGPFNVTVTQDDYNNIIDAKGIDRVITRASIIVLSNARYGNSVTAMKTLEREQKRVRENGCDVGIRGSINEYFMVYTGLADSISPIIKKIQESNANEITVKDATKFFTNCQISINEFIKLNNVYVHFVKNLCVELQPVFAKQAA